MNTKKSVAPKKAATKKAVAKKAAPKKPVYKFTFEVEGNTIIFRRNGNTLHNITLSLDSVDISCGILAVSNISSLENVFREVPEKTIVSAIKASISAIKSDNEVAFLLFSNNNKTKRTNLLLNDLAICATGWRKNPQTGNKIKIWTV